MGFIGIHMRSLLPQVQKLITKFLSFLFNLIFKAMLEILITHDDAYFNFHFFFFSPCDLLKLQKKRKKKVGCSSNSIIIWFHKVIFCSNFLGTKSCITGSESQGFPFFFSLEFFSPSKYMVLHGQKILSLLFLVAKKILPLISPLCLL